MANDDKILVTVSEDCMIKLWHMPELEQKHSETRGNIEPYLTLRGHTNCLLAASGRGNILFTAGVEGVIKMWSLPAVGEVNQYGDTFEGKNYCITNLYLEKQDVVWDLHYHPFQENLLCIGS